MKEICRIDYSNTEGTSPSPVSGTVTISSVNFPLKKDDETRRPYDQWFLCLFCCGATVLASAVFLLQDQENLTFNGPFRFEDLAENFQIDVQIYSMKTKSVRKHSSRSTCNKVGSEFQ